MKSFSALQVQQTVDMQFIIVEKAMHKLTAYTNSPQSPLKVEKKKKNEKLNRILLFSIYIRRKYLDSRKFSTSGFRWIYMFWDVFNTIWPFLENVWLCLSPKFSGQCISIINERKLNKLYIQLYLDIIWRWL